MQEDKSSYDSIKSVLDLVVNNLPKDKSQEKILLATSIAGLVGIALVKLFTYIAAESKKSSEE